MRILDHLKIFSRNKTWSQVEGLFGNESVSEVMKGSAMTLGKAHSPEPADPRVALVLLLFVEHLPRVLSGFLLVSRDTQVNQP